MMEIEEEIDVQSNPFSSIHFFLSGFDPHHHHQVRTKLVSVGGVEVGEYGPDCTHVIVHNLTSDDPICVRARRDRKTLVTSLWVDHSIDSGEPIDPVSIMYKPLKDLNGIPGAKDLVMCLTGYQRHEREDVMIMVSLMGAQFSKPLVANKVTHLICYKFEGEKYELARKFNTIKLLNHYWLADCLKAWKLLPEENYAKSAYELEMMGAEAKDSDDETGDTVGKPTDGRNINELGGTQQHPAMPSRVSSPSTQQKLPNSMNMYDMNFPIKEEIQSDQASKSTHLIQMGQHSPRRYKTPDRMAATSDNLYSENVTSNQIDNELPSTSGYAKISAGSAVEKATSCSRKTPPRKSTLPLSVGDGLGNINKDSSERSAVADNGAPFGAGKSPKRSRLSLHAGKSGICDGRLEENIAHKITDVCTANVEVDKGKSALANGEGPSSFELGGSNSAKRSPLNSRKTPKTSSLSLQTVEKVERTVVDMCISNGGPDKGVSASGGASSGVLPQKRKVDGQLNVSHATPKSQKLTAPASKRVDATEPTSSASNPLTKIENVSLNLSSHTGDETAKSLSADISTPNVSSVKSKVKSVAASRTLGSRMLQASKTMNVADMTSPSAGSVSTSTLTSIANEKAVPQNQQQKDTFSPSAKDLEDTKSGSPELYTDDQTGKSSSKPPRKKTVARKTLGSRPKLSKKTAAIQNGSLSVNPFQNDAAMHSTGQLDENHANFPVMRVPPAENDSIDLGLKSLLKSGNEVNDYEGSLDDETEPPPELDVQDEMTVTGELLHSGETSWKAGPGVLLQTDEADVANAAADKNGQNEPLPDTGVKKQNLATQKKGISGKTKKKTVAVKEKPNDADKAAGGKTSVDKVTEKEQVVCVTEKKRQGALPINKLEGLTEVQKEKSIVSDDEGTSKGGMHTKKLAGKKKGGTLLNKSEGPTEVQKDISVVSDDDGISKGGKHTKKVAGKKRRGTLLLNKSDAPAEVEMETEPAVLDEGKSNDEKNTDKLAAKLGLNQGSEETERENDPSVVSNQHTAKGGKQAAKLTGKKRRGTLLLKKSEGLSGVGKENEPVLDNAKGETRGNKPTKKLASKSNLTERKNDEMDVDTKALNLPDNVSLVKQEPAWFLLSGHKLQKKEFQQLIKRLKGKLCRDSHQWSYQATHFIVPDPLRRTEKFFAAAASGRWILKTDFLTASSQAGRFLAEEAYEWHKNGLSEDGAINLEAPRKWRLLREKTGHGAFYGMRIVIYGECIAPPLDTLKRAVKAGDGTILATSPPYTRFLNSGVDFAIVSPGMPRVDVWVQEFLRHEIPCVSADYLVEYVCKPGFSLDKHVQYNTHQWAAKSFSKLISMSEECVFVVDAPKTPDNKVSSDLACVVCGSTDRGEVMLVCGDNSGSSGCGIGTHIDCCDPPLEDIPEEDWFCPKCTESRNKTTLSTKKKAASKIRS